MKMTLPIVVALLTLTSFAHADNCYVLNGYPEDQARCEQQAQKQEAIEDKTAQQFQAQNTDDSAAMNNALLLDQLRALTQKDDPDTIKVDPRENQ